MKKLIITGLVVTAGAYVTGKVALKVVPIVIRQNMAEQSGNPVTPKYKRVIAGTIMQRLPYAQFCEITGCKVEVHSNFQELITESMSDHLSKDH